MASSFLPQLTDEEMQRLSAAAWGPNGLAASVAPANEDDEEETPQTDTPEEDDSSGDTAPTDTTPDEAQPAPAVAAQDMKGYLDNQQPAAPKRGLLSQFFGTNPNTGTTFANRLLAAGMGLGGEGAAEGAYLQGIEQKTYGRKIAQAALQRQIAGMQIKNDAFKSAWVADPNNPRRKVFDYQAYAGYIAAHGGMTDAVGDAKALKDVINPPTYENKPGTTRSDAAGNPLVSIPAVPLLAGPNKQPWIPDTQPYGPAVSGSAAPVATGAPGPGSEVGASASAVAAANGAGQYDPKKVHANMLTTESGNTPGKIGPKTPYGVPVGIGQMLPGTAQEMAQNLGIPWRPDLMTGTDAGATAYQKVLSQAYYHEGLQKYGGDARMAAGYYHGGPNEKIWGPKTHAYMDTVTKGAEMAPQPAAAGAGWTPDQAALSASAGGPTGVAPSAVAPPAVAAAPSGPGSGGHYAAGADNSPRWVNTSPGVLQDRFTGNVKEDPTYGISGAVDPAVVQMVVDGQYPIPTGARAAGPQWIGTLKAAHAIDPTFNTSDYGNRVKVRADFTSGKDFQQILALNQMMGHAQHFLEASAAVGGMQGPLWSHLSNKVQQQVMAQRGMSGPLKAMNVSAQGLSSEATKVFRGGEGGEKDVQGFLTTIGDPYSSHAERVAAATMLVKMAGSRLDAEARGYQAGMGKAVNPLSFLGPTQAAFYKSVVGQQAPATNVVPKPGGDTNAPPPWTAAIR